jgi:cell shape-determining protein MreC
VQNQSAVLSRECLIGWVEETGPLASRVVLLSDPAANKALHVRILDKAGEFTLKGAGSGQMKLVEMPREFVENGKVEVGDKVMSHPNDPKLPVPIAIGRIKELHRVKEKPVYYEATVEPACAVKSLRQVFIVDLSKSELQQNSTSKNP